MAMAPAKTKIPDRARSSAIRDAYIRLRAWAAPQHWANVTDKKGSTNTGHSQKRPVKTACSANILGFPGEPDCMPSPRNKL